MLKPLADFVSAECLLHPSQSTIFLLYLHLAERPKSSFWGLFHEGISPIHED